MAGTAAPPPLARMAAAPGPHTRPGLLLEWLQADAHLSRADAQENAWVDSLAHSPRSAASGRRRTGSARPGRRAAPTPAATPRARGGTSWVGEPDQSAALGRSPPCRRHRPATER